MMMNKLHRKYALVCVLILSCGMRSHADQPLLTGKAAMGDWTTDRPGVRRKIAVSDLPAPHSNVLDIKPPRVVSRPPGAELHVPQGFKVELYASGLRDPRYLLTGP